MHNKNSVNTANISGSSFFHFHLLFFFYTSRCNPLFSHIIWVTDLKHL